VFIECHDTIGLMKGRMFCPLKQSAIIQSSLLQKEGRLNENWWQYDFIRKLARFLEYLTTPNSLIFIAAVIMDYSDKSRRLYMLQMMPFLVLARAAVTIVFTSATV